MTRKNMIIFTAVFCLCFYMTAVYALYQPIEIAPVDEVLCTGYVGEPATFTPTSIIYDLTNWQTNSTQVTAVSDQTWLTVPLDSQTVPGNQTRNLTATLDASAFLLTPGFYTATVSFTHTLTNGTIPQLRVVKLHVKVRLCEAVDNCGFTWTTGGDAEWYGQIAQTHDTVDAAQSGAIDNDEETWVEAISYNPGDLSFWWKVSSEATYAPLEFYVNGVLMDSISGNVDWTQATYTLPASDPDYILTGEFVLRWRYAKNRAYAVGSDAGWLDEVTFVPEDSLTVLPGTPTVYQECGPIADHTAIACTDYVITNADLTDDLLWEVSKPAQVDWIDIAPVSGTLAAGNSATVTVCLNANAETLGAGAYPAVLTFLNTVTSYESNRSFNLLLSESVPPMVSTPSPANLETEVAPVAATLSWVGGESGGCQTEYTVYFGTDPLALAVIYGPGTDLSCALPMLAETTTYYWQVVAENCCGAAPASPIWEFTTGTLNALVYFVPCGGGVNYAAAALQNLEFSALTVTDAATFESELNDLARNWEVVIVDVQGGTLDSTTLDALTNYYDNRDGRIIFSHSNLDAYPGVAHLFLERAGVEYVSSYTTADNVYVWQADPMFTLPNTLPGILIPEALCPEFGHYVKLRGESTAAAGYTFEAEVGTAAIVVNSDERIVFNAFRPQTITSDNNNNGKPDMVELYENQLVIATPWGCDPDETPPEITLLGANPATLECGDTYETPGVYAWDFCEGVLTDSVDIDISQLNAQLVGSYTVSYSVTDATGNTSVTLDRTVNVMDTTAPLISLLGDALYTMECGYPYESPGAFALDACDGNLTDVINVDDSLLDTSAVGVYTVTYSVTDGAGFTSQVDRTVAVVDTELPIITLLGDNPMTVECGDAYVEPGATAADACTGDMTASIIIGGDVVDSGVVGAYSVTYTVTDPEGNSVEETRVVDVVDTTIPVITLTGDASVTTECSLPYTDAGATALDVCDGDLTASIVTVNPVDTAVVGTYVVTYNVTDAQGNVAVEVTRSVEVVDTTPADISLGTFDPANYASDGFLLHECSTAFVEPDDFAVIDACDGDLGDVDLALNPGDTGVTAWAWSIAAGVYSPESVYAYDAFTALRGDYLLVYVSADISGNVYPTLDGRGLPDLFDVDGNPTFIDGDGIVSLTVDYARLVRIQDTTVPDIALLGDNPLVLECAAEYVSPGVLAADTCDGDISANVDIDTTGLDTGNVGEYPVLYSVTDASGNVSAVLTRTVQVVDTTIPVITLIGEAEIIMECGDVYVEPGATADDACDGDISADVVIGGDVVDIVRVGTYILTYNVVDNEGNAAEEVTRVVRIQDTMIPIITLNGTAEVTVECGDPYTDAGATAADHCDGDLTGEIVVVGADVVDTNTVGIYVITFNVTDGEGHAAVEVTRTVTVEDTQVPIITRLGDENVVIECADIYVDAGATADDHCDGDITSSIVTVNPVDTAVVGTYTVTYNVTDGQGNVAVEVTRTVVVENTTVPEIVLPAVYVPIDCGKEFDTAFAAVTAAFAITAANPCGDLTADIRVTEIKATYPRRGDEITYTVDSLNTLLVQEGKITGLEGAYTGTISETITIFQNYFLFKPAIYEITYAVQEPQPTQTTQIIRIDDQCRGPLGCYSCDSCAAQRPTINDVKQLMSSWFLFGISMIALASLSRFKR
jgi:hypothetical protein